MIPMSDSAGQQYLFAGWLWTHKPISGSPAVLAALHLCENGIKGFSIWVKASNITPCTEKAFKVFFSHEVSLKYISCTRCFLKAVKELEDARQSIPAAHPQPLPQENTWAGSWSNQQHRVPASSVEP